MPPVTLSLQTVPIRGIRAALGLLGMLGIVSPLILAAWAAVAILPPLAASVLAVLMFFGGIWAVLRAARITASCPACHHSLRVTLYRERFRCPHCDRRVLVEWE